MKFSLILNYVSQCSHTVYTVFYNVGKTGIQKVIGVIKKIKPVIVGNILMPIVVPILFPKVLRTVLLIRSQAKFPAVRIFAFSEPRKYGIPRIAITLVLPNAMVLSMIYLQYLGLFRGHAFLERIISFNLPILSTILIGLNSIGFLKYPKDTIDFFWHTLKNIILSKLKRTSTNWYGDTLAHSAVLQKDYAVLDTLNETDLKKPNERDGKTPMDYAVEMLRTEDPRPAMVLAAECFKKRLKPLFHTFKKNINIVELIASYEEKITNIENSNFLRSFILKEALNYEFCKRRNLFLSNSASKTTNSSQLSRAVMGVPTINSAVVRISHIDIKHKKETIFV